MQYLSILVLSIMTAALPAAPDTNRQALLVGTDSEEHGAMNQVLDEFMRAKGIPAKLVRLSSGKGPEADVLLWTGAGKDGSFPIEPDSRTAVGRKRLAILTRQGNPKGIVSIADLGTTDLRIATAAPGWPALHRASEAALGRVSGSAKIRANCRWSGATAEELVALLRTGQVDAVLGWNTLEAFCPTDIDAVALPEELAPPLTLYAAVCRKSTRKPQARLFVAFCSSVLGQAILGHGGYHVPLHEEGAETYDQLAEGRLGPTYPLTARRLLLESGIRRGRCLDLGCGTGHLAVALAGMSELSITGLDIDPAMINLARRRIKKADLEERVHFVVGDVHRLPFENQHADLIVSRGSLVFWKDPAAAFREVRRVLKPTGFALLGGRYLFTPPRFLKSTRELEELVAASGVPDARVITDRGQWVEIRGAKWRPPDFDFRSRMGQLAGRLVADYGITMGRGLVLANRFTGIEIELTARTELSVVSILPKEEAAVAAAKAVEAAKLGERITCRSGDVHRLPFKPGSINLVVSVGALPFWQDKPAVFREIHRILAPGGAALLGGRYRFMPQRFKVTSEDLRKMAAASGIGRIRVIDDMGQWVEIRR